MSNYKFFQNKECEFYPCHNNCESLNCLFCYCPLYPFDCGGNFKILADGTKDCSECLVPHKRENWDNIISKLTEFSRRK